MSKLILTFLLSTVFLITVPVTANPDNEKDRQEMMILKNEQAKLQAEERLLRLKQALNLKQEQMDAWATYEKHMKANAGKKMAMIAELRQKRAETGKPPTSLELGKANIARLEQQLTTAKERLVVFSELYKVLDKEQQATVDKLALRKVRKAARNARKQRSSDRGDRPMPKR